MKDSCREVLQRAYLILDGEDIAAEEKVSIETHLQECGPCWERWGVEQEMKRLIGRLRGCDACPDDLKARIGNLLDDSA